MLENLLMEWICRMDAINGYVTDEIIMTKAKEFGHKLNVDDMQFSKRWLYRFKNWSTQKITNDKVKNLKEVKVDLQKFIQMKTVQKALDNILNK